MMEARLRRVGIARLVVYMAATVEIAFSGVPLVAQPQTTPTYLTQIASACGTQTLSQSKYLLTKVFSDDDSVDWDALQRDARALIAVSDSCLPNIPTCKTVGCDDAAFVLLESNLLLAQNDLGRALVANNDINSGQVAFVNAFDTAIYLCQSPNVTAHLMPYKGAQAILATALGNASRLQQYAGIGSEIDQRSEQFQDCASKLGLSINFAH